MKVFQAEPGTWAGVLVSLLAMGVAIWQAVVAKQQAKVATTAAEDSRRQAVAAEQQVAIMREQVDGENADRAEARRPRFDAVPSPMDYSEANHVFAEILLTQTGGVALSRVECRASGEYVNGLRQSRYQDEFGWAVGDVVIEGMSAGSGGEQLFVHFEYRHVTPTRVDLELLCTAREGGSWTEYFHLTVTEPEQAPPPTGRRRCRA